LSIRLIERAALGTTVVAAATTRLLERAERANRLNEVVNIIGQALLADLSDAVAPSVRRMADRAATDPDIGQLMDACGPLAEAIRYGDVRASDVGAMEEVFDGIIVRIIAGLPPATRSLDDDAATALVERLSMVHAALAMLDHPARHGRFASALERLALRQTGSGLLQGRATRLLHDLGRWDDATVEHRLSRALSLGTPAAMGAAFVEGFVAGSGTVLVHDRDLLDVIDRWLCALDPSQFDGIVALLRRTFSGFEVAERRQLMDLVTAGRRDSQRTFDADVDPARAAAALVTVRQLLGLPVHDVEPSTGSGGGRP
jgi:hypothetical protein